MYQKYNKNNKSQLPKYQIATSDYHEIKWR